MSIHIRDLKLHGVDEAALLQEQALYEGARRGEGLSDDKTEKLLPNREPVSYTHLDVYKRQVSNAMKPLKKQSRGRKNIW